jgi:hypothetical protein
MLRRSRLRLLESGFGRGQHIQRWWLFHTYIHTYTDKYIHSLMHTYTYIARLQAHVSEAVAQHGRDGVHDKAGQHIDGVQFKRVGKVQPHINALRAEACHAVALHHQRR